MTAARLPSPALLACVVAAALAGCSIPHRAQHLTPAPFGASAWASPIAREHPLVGIVFDVRQARTAGAVDVVEAATSADFVLLGEQHDNEDHHRLQAAVLRALLETGRRPSVAFEQLDLEDQPAVDAVVAGRGADDAEPLAAQLADRVEWSKSGWPPFDQYRDLFEIALDAGLPIRAANLSRQAMMHVLSHGSPGKSSPRSVGKVAEPAVELPGDARATLATEIEESHCGYADDRVVSMMIEAQRRRDDVMAKVLAESATEGGAVLIAGFGHARSDYGVPLYLRQRAPGKRMTTIGFVEVIPGLDDPAAYSEVMHVARVPFDFVVFTPRASDEDPCEKFREGLEKMKAAHGRSGAAAPSPAGVAK